MTVVTQPPPEETTERLKRYFQHIFANSRDVMNLFSLTEGRIIMLNKAAEEVTGYSLEELMKLPIQALYPAEEHRNLALAFERLERTGYSSDKFRMYARGGEVRDIWTMSYVIQRTPEAICLVHTIDITEENRKRERELRNARLATLGESSATLAHELKNALQSIQFGLSTLRVSLAKRNTERVEQSLVRLERAARHMDDVILGVEKAARRSNQTVGYCSLTTLVEDALLLMRGYFEAKAIHVSTQFEGVPPVHCDRTHVEQILLVLIKNAAQAMASRPTRELTIRAFEVGEHVELEIRDTGGGLPAEVRSQMFQPFTTTKPVGVGTGIGLSTAKQLAESNGIDLWFRSEPGRGTSFFLRFCSSALQPSEEYKDSPLFGRVVLVVSDDPNVLELASRALAREGARALVTGSVSEALQWLRVHAVESLICDDAMYPIPGAAFAREARSRYRGPICLLMEPDSDQVRPEGASSIECVLTKPLDPNALVQALATLTR